MFRRRKKAVLVIWLTWGRKERVRVQDNSKVPDFGGGGDGGAVTVKGEALSGVSEGVRTNDEDFDFHCRFHFEFQY